MPDNTSGATAARIEGRELLLERTFDAPRELVFKAFTEPERMVHWFGPRGWGLTVFEADVRPGGVFRYRMFSETGEESYGRTVYQEVVDSERLVYTDAFADAHGNPVPNAPVMHTTINFVDADGKTHMTLVTEFDSVAALASGLGTGMIQGWSETLDRLAEYLDAA